MPAAYSYLRFSSPQQASGDSLRRQTAARDKWLASRPDVTLDQSLTLTDAGRSGFNREGSWDTYALAQFVAHVKSGRVPKGSYLLVENLDRLSRESAGEATELFLSIVNKGIVIVQLSPVVMEFAKPVEMMSLMYAILELSRGHSESKIKSERLAAVWAKKHADAAAAKKVVSKQVPSWMRVRDGRIVLDPAGAAIVRRIVEMAKDQGTYQIARKLRAEHVPKLARRTYGGRPVVWSPATVYTILNSPALFGRYVPKAREADRGEPIDGYFPPLITETEFHAIRAGLKTRKHGAAGRLPRQPNIFGGLLREARTDRSLTYKRRTGCKPILVPVGVAETWTSFPAESFDRLIIAQLAEVTVADVQGESTDAAKRVADLLREMRGVEELSRAWEAKMNDPLIVDRVAAKLGELEKERRGLADKIAEAQLEVVSPVADALGGLKTLADLLATDTSAETRTKVRTAVRHVVASVHVLFVLLEERKRAAVVLVKFVGAEGRFRLYAIRPTADGYAVDPPSRTWLTNTLDIRTAEGRERAERFVRELVKRAQETSQSAKAAEVGTDASAGRLRIGVGRGETVAASRAAPDRGAETGKRPARRRKAKR